MRYNLKFLLALVLVAACAPNTPIEPPVPQPRYDAVVDAKFTGRDGDVVSGARAYHTVGAALDAAPHASTTPHVVYIRNGRYREKLSVDKPMITLLGESRDSTVLTFDATADSPQVGGGTVGTRGSFTLRVTAPGFRAEHITIENAFDYRANQKKAEADPTRIRNTQAVALFLDRGSDRAVVVDCTLSGWHDTLYANAGRSYFHNSIILGTTDFIFGAGVAVFDDCDIVSRAAGFVTAPSTPPLQRYGFVFVGSHLRRESNLVKVGSVFIGRPWHPSSNPDVNPSAVFIDCDMDDHIAATGWTSMGMHEPLAARFFEYKSHGVGSVKDPIRRILTDAEVRPYAIKDVLAGWAP